MDINFVLSVSEVGHKPLVVSDHWSVPLIHIYVSLDANMLWMIVSKAAERSSNMIMAPYLDEAVLCNLYSMCVMAVSVLLKDVYAL